MIFFDWLRSVVRRSLRAMLSRREKQGKGPAHSRRESMPPLRPSIEELPELVLRVTDLGPDVTDDEVLRAIRTIPIHCAIGLGCDFQISVNAGVSYNTFGSILDITAPQPATTDKDVSFMGMANAWKLFVAGLIDGGEGKLKILFSATNYQTAINNLRTPNYFKIVMNDRISSTNSTLAFQGYVKALGKAIPLDDNIVCDITVKASGQVTFTPAT